MMRRSQLMFCFIAVATIFSAHCSGFAAMEFLKLSDRWNWFLLNNSLFFTGPRFDFSVCHERSTSFAAHAIGLRADEAAERLQSMKTRERQTRCGGDGQNKWSEEEEADGAGRGGRYEDEEKSGEEESDGDEPSVVGAPRSGAGAERSDASTSDRDHRADEGQRQTSASASGFGGWASSMKSTIRLARSHPESKKADRQWKKDMQGTLVKVEMKFMDGRTPFRIEQDFRPIPSMTFLERVVGSREGPRELTRSVPPVVRDLKQRWAKMKSGDEESSQDVKLFLAGQEEELLEHEELADVLRKALDCGAAMREPTREKNWERYDEMLKLAKRALAESGSHSTAEELKDMLAMVETVEIAYVKRLEISEDPDDDDLKMIGDLRRRAEKAPEWTASLSLYALPFERSATKRTDVKMASGNLSGTMRSGGDETTPDDGRTDVKLATGKPTKLGGGDETTSDDGRTDVKLVAGKPKKLGGGDETTPDDGRTDVKMSARTLSGKKLSGGEGTAGENITNEYKMALKALTEEERRPGTNTLAAMSLEMDAQEAANKVRAQQRATSGTARLRENCTCVIS